MYTNPEARCGTIEDNISSSNWDTNTVTNNYGVFTHDINDTGKEQEYSINKYEEKLPYKLGFNTKPSQSNKISYLKL